MLQGAELVIVNNFEYPGSTIQSKGGCRVQAGWSVWILEWFVTERILAKTKGNVYKTSEASYVVWTRDSGNDKNTGNKVRGGIIEHDEIFVGNNEVGQDEKWAYL